MANFESPPGNNIFYDFWKQVQEYIFSQNRFFQLITLKPIEIYNEKIELEVDTAKIKLHVKSTLENLMQRGIDRTLSVFFVNRTTDKKIFQYDFNVVIDANMTYNDVSKFFNFHFGEQTFPLGEVPEKNSSEPNAFQFLEKIVPSITLGKFNFYNEGDQLATTLPFNIDAQWKFIKQHATGKITATADIDYQPQDCLIRTGNLKYTLQSKNIILKGIDKYYHEQIIAQLYRLLQYTFETELQKVKEDAQQQINSLQEQNKWMVGTVNNLRLDHVFIKDDGVHATLSADGFIDLI